MSAGQEKLLARAITSLSSQITEVNRTVNMLTERISILSAQVGQQATAGASSSHAPNGRDTDSPHVERQKRLSFAGAARMLAVRHHSQSEADSVSRASARPPSGLRNANGFHKNVSESSLHPQDTASSNGSGDGELRDFTGDESEMKHTMLRHMNGFAVSAPKDVRGLCGCEYPRTDLYHYNPSSGWVVNRDVGLPPWLVRNFSFGVLMNMCWRRFFGFLLGCRVAASLFIAVLFAIASLLPSAAPPLPAAGAWRNERVATVSAGDELLNGFETLETLETAGGETYEALLWLLRALSLDAQSVTGGVEALQSFLVTAWWLFSAGLLFHRIARPCNPLVLSDKLCVAAVLGRPTLVARAVVARPPWYLLDVRVSLTWVHLVIDPVTQSTFQKHDDLEVERETCLFFDIMKVMRHVINLQSPLYGKTFAQLAAARSVFQLTIIGTEPLSGQTVATTHSYRATEDSTNAVFYGRQFEPFLEGKAAVPADVRESVARDPSLPEMPAEIPVLKPLNLHKLEGDVDVAAGAWGKAL